MVGLRSLHDNLTVTPSLNVAPVTATTTGAAVSLVDSHAWAFQLTSGAYTDGTHTLHFEERFLGEGVDWRIITPEFLRAPDGLLDATGQVIISDGSLANSSILIGYIGGLEEVRVVISDVSGVTTGAIYGVSIVKGNLHTRGVTF